MNVFTVFTFGENIQYIFFFVVLWCANFTFFFSLFLWLSTLIELFLSARCAYLLGNFFAEITSEQF